MFRNLRHSWLRPQRFVRASSDDVTTVEHRQQRQQNELKGDEVSDFYEGVIRDSKAKKRNKKSVNSGSGRREKKTVATKEESNKKNTSLDRLFAAAQSNDVDTLSEWHLKESTADVDCRDRFGWTLLMSAACQGSVNVIAFLLSRSARTDCADKAGNTALSLAIRHGRVEVVGLLRRQQQREEKEEDEVQLVDDAEGGSPPEFFCEACQTRVVGREARRRHRCSTVHLLRASSPSRTKTVYGISEANRGFQMMLREGWDREGGLGPAGREGKKFPVKTVLKRDRRGVGADGAVPRVTHFGPNDPGGVEFDRRTERVATADKRRRDGDRRRGVRKEKLLRQELAGL